MTRQEIYKAMELEKIIMYDEFRAKLNKLPQEELEARWIGILELDKEHKIKKHRADWLAMFMWNSTALTVGEAEIARRKEEQRRKEILKTEEEQKRKEKEIYQILSKRKLEFWHSSSRHDKECIIHNFFQQSDSFAREYVREDYLHKLEYMEDQAVLMWFWRLLPPFSVPEKTVQPQNSTSQAA